MLIELGVDYAQGYAVHKPQPFEEILDLSSHNQSAS
jgi:EAL domain-containing protein (putative c-di-GMP-specific phosphodiesterase class I)